MQNKVYGSWKYTVFESIRSWLKVYGHGLKVYSLGVKYTVLDVNYTVFDEMYTVIIFSSRFQNAVQHLTGTHVVGKCSSIKSLCLKDFSSKVWGGKLRMKSEARIWICYRTEHCSFTPDEAYMS